MARWKVFSLVAAVVAVALVLSAQEPPKPPNDSFSPVVLRESFEATRTRMVAEKPAVMRRQLDLLNMRYDLADRPSGSAAMFRGKPVQTGVRVKLPSGVTWDRLAAMSPAEIRERNLFPAGFLPLPHPHQKEGGMVFPQVHIDEVRRQTRRDLQRFDLDFDVPQHFLPEFPPPVFLTTRPDLGDFSRGKLITMDNFFELANGVLNPKDIDGLRLLVTPFPQQQFNATNDRRSDRPSDGVTCFDCHANGHTNAATHLVGDIPRRNCGGASIPPASAASTSSDCSDRSAR